MNIKPLPPLSRLRMLFSYEPDTGIIRWRSLSSKVSPVGIGEEAGFLHNGYRRIGIDGENYPAARIAYALAFDELPPTDFVVYHNNGIRDDNRKENLILSVYRDPQYPQYPWL